MSDCCHKKTTWNHAAFVTVHCLTGCAIGEFAGLLIGVTFAFGVAVTVPLTFVLAFISGFYLAMRATKKRTNLNTLGAFKLVFWGEITSITVMEIVMNLVDYNLGGMSANSLFHLQFWIGFIPAMIAGYFAALPINYWLLTKNLKHCH